MESTIQTPVFVYGTLKPGGFYHETYCGGFRFDAEEGRVHGNLYDFPALGYPGATENKANSIKGVLLTFHHEESEVLGKLDVLEEYDRKRPPEQNEYYRKQVVVFDEAKQAICKSAWCYFMEQKKVAQLNRVLLQSGYWPQ